MKTVKEHYDEHLAAVYDWMTGGFENAVDGNRNFFSRLQFDDLPRGLAIDLGAGSGFQSIPLAEIGFSVLAVDFSAALLAILQTRTGNLSINTVQDDILNFPRYLKGKVELIVCMGDTLTHLKSFGDVRELLSDISKSIVENGVLILTFRDYFSTELRGNQRFIPVRSDNAKIFTCFLEYFDRYVEVHDLLYTKDDAGWKLSISSYPKLKLEPKAVADELRKLGFSSISNESESGMVIIIARKG